jgi:hypothetical protein
MVRHHELSFEPFSLAHDGRGDVETHVEDVGVRKHEVGGTPDHGHHRDPQRSPHGTRTVTVARFVGWEARRRPEPPVSEQADSATAKSRARDDWPAGVTRII